MTFARTAGWLLASMAFAVAAPQAVAQSGAPQSGPTHSAEPTPAGPGTPGIRPSGYSRGVNPTPHAHPSTPPPGNVYKSGTGPGGRSNGGGPKPGPTGTH